MILKRCKERADKEPENIRSKGAQKETKIGIKVQKRSKRREE